jgi:hypothetical protein
MEISSMKSLFALLLACFLVAGTATAVTNLTASDSIYYKEMGGASCVDHSVPGLKGESLVAIVELSGHSNVLIDGKKVEPDRTGTYQDHPTGYYKASPGSRTIVISQTGYTNYIAYRTVCSGKVTYALYDQEAHLFQGTTRTPVTTTPVPETTTPVILTTTTTGQSGDYGALKSALGSSSSPDNYGSLSVATDPAGATIYIDGVKQGISPATIPGIRPGTHTLILKLEGYDDLSLPITISAGKSHTYSSALMKSKDPQIPAAGIPATRKSSAPGFEIVIAACLLGALLIARKTS